MMNLALFKNIAKKETELQANNASINLGSHIIRFMWMKCIESTRDSGIYYGLLDEIEPLEDDSFIESYLTWFRRLHDDTLMASVVRTADSIKIMVVNYDDDTHRTCNFFKVEWAIGSTEYDIDSFVSDSFVSDSFVSDSFVSDANTIEEEDDYVDDEAQKC